MNVLVINMTRLGDLLQSQAAVSGLAAQGHRVGLACLENFAPAAGLMRGVDALFPLPGARLLARLDADWRLALAAYREALDRMRGEFAPGVVINLTPSEPARLMAMSLGAAEACGFVLDDHGFNADTSSWAAFLQLASTSRGASPFNIVDIFRRISGLGAGSATDSGLLGPDPAALATARERLATALPGRTANGYVAVQLGASEERRRWPVARFAHVADGLSAVGYTPVLVGTAAEKPLGERLKSACKAPLIDLMGETDLPELAAVLANCRLLVTNDTGTMHLAAGLDVPCLAIFLATAQPWDTGPARPGSICLEPDLDCHPCGFGRDCPHRESGTEACRSVIAPEGVLALAMAMLGGTDPPTAAPGARVWRTVTGADGLLDLESLSGHEGEDRTRLIRLQRELYRRHLDGEPVVGGAPAGISPAAAEPLARALTAASELLFLLESQGRLLGRDPLKAMKAKFLANWHRVQGALSTDPRLAVLSALWLFESERPGLDMPDILALATRFRALIDAMRESIGGGMIRA